MRTAAGSISHGLTNANRTMRGRRHFCTDSRHAEFATSHEGDLADGVTQIGEVVTTIPTIGFNVESVTYKNLNFNVWVRRRAASPSAGCG